MRFLPLAAAVFAFSALAGCATTVPVIDASTYPPASADPAHLVFGVHGRSAVTNLWSGRPLEDPDMAGRLINAGQIRESVVLSTDSCGLSCDVVVTIACSPDLGSGPARLTASSAARATELFSATEKGNCERAAEALGRRLKAAFAPGTALYEMAMAEKRSRFNLAPPPAPEAAEAPKPAAENSWWEKPAATGR